MRPIHIAVFALTANLFSTYACLAQQHQYFYDSNGNNVGSSTIPAGQNTFYYDGQRNNIGSAIKAGKTDFIMMLRAIISAHR